MAIKLGKVFKDGSDDLRSYVPIWKMVIWGFFVPLISFVLRLLIKAGVVGGFFITPFGVGNKKETHPDGSQSITFYDKETEVYAND